MKKTLFILLLFSGLACTKSKDSQPAESLNETMLYGRWKLAAKTSDKPYDFNNDGTAETNVYASLAACSKDYSFSLSQSHTGDIKQTCVQTYKEISWSLNGSVLAFSINGGGTFSERIISLSSNVLITTSVMQPPPTFETYTITTTYIK